MTLPNPYSTVTTLFFMFSEKIRVDISGELTIFKNYQTSLFSEKKRQKKKKKQQQKTKQNKKQTNKKQNKTKQQTAPYPLPPQKKKTTTTTTKKQNKKKKKNTHKKKKQQHSSIECRLQQISNDTSMLSTWDKIFSRRHIKIFSPENSF